MSNSLISRLFTKVEKKLSKNFFNYPKIYTFLFVLLLLNIPTTKTSQFSNALPDDKLVLLKNEFNTFLSKYKSNSCIMKIFTNFKSQCENLNDLENSKLSLKMTLCIYSSLERKINNPCKLDIDQSDNYDSIQETKKCIKSLQGDLWTTFISFSQHIDNLCFYYKTLIWEKSSEFLFQKLMNSSLSVLTELSQSYDLAEKMFSKQENFSVQVEKNLAETLSNFNNINQFFENYTRVEEKLKENINVLENKINSNNEKIIDVVRYIDEKLVVLKFMYEFFNTSTNSNSLFFFLILFSLVWFLTMIKSLKSSRIVLNILLFLFFLTEKFLLPQFFQNFSYVDLSFIYYNLIFYVLRVFYCLVILTVMFLKFYYYKPKNKEICRENQSAYKKGEYTKEIWTDYKSLLSLTPVWMKKYFTKIKMQNDYLIEKFQTMKELLERENLEEIRNFKNKENFKLAEDVKNSNYRRGGNMIHQEIKDENFYKNYNFYLDS
jgi:hypothetical protein